MRLMSFVHKLHFDIINRRSWAWTWHCPVCNNHILSNISMAHLNVFCCICCYFPFKVIYILLSLKLLSTIFTFIRISFIFVKNLQCQNPWTIGIPRFSCNTLIMVVHSSMHRIFSLHKLHQFKNAKLLFPNSFK